MTCRIDRLLTDQGLVLHISGRITGDVMDVLRNALEDSDVVAVELAQLDLIDREGVKLLAIHEAKGIELRNCPAYIREWVTSERSSN